MIPGRPIYINAIVYLNAIYKLHKSGCRSDLLKQDSYLADLREQDVDLQIEGGTICIR